LASCNEHVAEANISRPYPPTPSVLYTVPKAQSSRGWRSNLTFPFGKHARAPPEFPVPVPNCHTEFLIFCHSPRPFFPACSPPPSCFFARHCSPADGPVRSSD
jgi:hypothetical protein